MPSPEAFLSGLNSHKKSQTYKHPCIHCVQCECKHRYDMDKDWRLAWICILCMNNESSPVFMHNRSNS